MKINILRLKNASGDSISFETSKEIEAIEYYGQEVKFVNPIKVIGDITNNNNLYELRGSARARVSTACANCLESYQWDIEAELDEVYAPSEVNTSQDYTSETVSFNGDHINIEPEVIKALIIEMPMRMVCSDDCLGLCPLCGRNLNTEQCKCEKDNIDPRLAILKNLQL